MRHQAKVTADERSPGPARHKSRDAVLPIDLTLPALERWRGPHADGYRWLAHDALPLPQRVDRHVERRDVAVADQRLRRAPHLTVVKERQDARSTVPPAHTPHRVDAVIGEHGVHIG